MAVSCVRTESQEFKDKAKALNITEGQLENILHEYYNSEELQNSFTEDEFINTKLNGVPLDISSEVIHQAWENAYSQPLVFDNIDDYKRALESARNIFDKDAVGITESPDGKYTIRVAEPFNYREEDNIYYSINTTSTKEGLQRRLYDEERKLSDTIREINSTETALRGERIYQKTLSTPDGDIVVFENESAKTNSAADKDIIWLSSGRSIFSAVSMSLKAVAKDNTIGGSIIFPAKKTDGLGDNYKRDNPIKSSHASLLSAVLNYLIEKGSIRPHSDWVTYGRSIFGVPSENSYSSKIAQLSEDLGIDVSKYFMYETRRNYDDKTIEERVEVDAKGLLEALSSVTNTNYYTDIKEALSFNEASKMNYSVKKKALINKLNTLREQYNAQTQLVSTLKDDIRRSEYDNSDLPFNTNLEENSIIKNLINNPISSNYFERVGDKVKLKGNRAEAIKALQLYVESRQLPSDYIGVTKEGYLYEKTRKYPLQDQIEAYKESEDLFENAEQQEQAMQVLEFLKEKTGLNFEFISEDRAKELLNGKSIDGVNAFVKGDTAYFIKGNNRRFNTDIASEEMLHPFILSIRKENTKAFEIILNELNNTITIGITHARDVPVNTIVIIQAIVFCLCNEYFSITVEPPWI